MTSSIISATLARKLMRQGCGAYLAHIVDTQLESPCMKDVDVVCDFPEVFPKNHPGLPQKERLNFQSSLFMDLPLFPSYLMEWSCKIKRIEISIARTS